MARRANLIAGTLSPFGSTGAGFGAFNIIDVGREAYLKLLKVQVEWEAGRVSNTDYLAAVKAYAKALPAGSTKVEAESRVEQLAYNFKRAAIIADIDAGTKTYRALVNFDRASLAGLNTSSQEYRDRVARMNNAQEAWFSEREDEVVERYSDGKMTTAQLVAWYKDIAADDLLAGDSALAKTIRSRLDDLEDRLVAEKDTKAISDYQDGKMTGTDFLAYATNAQARYAKGTTDYDAWADRIAEVKDVEAETGFLYRYNLSQEYLQLSEFVQSNKAPTGGTSTSTSKRVVLGADGTWKVVESTTTRPYAPSASEQEAWRRRRVEVEAAKVRMNAITKQLGGLGGFVSSQAILSYYTSVQSRYAKGTAKWYAIQEKIDSANDRISAEKVLSQQGIRVSYPGTTQTSAPSAATPGAGGGGASTARRPGGGGGTTGGGTANTTLDQFMSAIASVESGGRYDARNKSSGAYGKYQIMPANWGAWAAKYLGNANAPMSPENQEKVAKGKFTDLYKWLGSWEAVAHWWLTGGSNKAGHNDPSTWSSSSRNYVNKVMSGIGAAPIGGSIGGAEPSASVAGSRSVTVYAGPKPSGAGPLLQVTGVRSNVEQRGAATGDISRTKVAGKPSFMTEATGFPVNLDGEAFKKFYTQYSAAWERGDVSFTDPNSGATYFLGDDPAERMNLMGQLDTLRVQLFDTRAVAYAGTPSEITAENQRAEAVKDAAAHAYQMIGSTDITAGPRTPGTNVANPLAEGVELLNTVKRSIQSSLALARSAFDRGDLTAAYAHLTTARTMATAGGGAAQGDELAGFSTLSQQAVAAISSQFGGLDPGEVLGGKSGEFQKGLDRLSGWQAELEGVFAESNDFVTEFESVVAKDGAGNIVFDSTGVGGAIKLDPDKYLAVDSNGKVTYETRPKLGYDLTTGLPKTEIPGRVKVMVNTGSGTAVSAFADYKVDVVGYIEKDGGKLPIYGKVVQYNDQTWVEDPFKPGSWSSKMVVYSGGANINVVGSTTSGAVAYQVTKDGGTYTFTMNKDTGLYELHLSKPGGLFSSEVEQDLGDATQANVAVLFSDFGLTRDLNGVTGDDLLSQDSDQAWLGFSPEQIRQFKYGDREVYGPPVPASYGRVRAGGAFGNAPTLTWQQQLSRVGEEAPIGPAVKPLSRLDFAAKVGEQVDSLPVLSRSDFLKRIGEGAQPPSAVRPIAPPPTTKPTPPPIVTGQSTGDISIRTGSTRTTTTKPAAPRKRATTIIKKPVLATITHEEQLRRVGEG